MCFRDAVTVDVALLRRCGAKGANVKGYLIYLPAEARTVTTRASVKRLTQPEALFAHCCWQMLAVRCRCRSGATVATGGRPRPKPEPCPSNMLNDQRVQRNPEGNCTVEVYKLIVLT